MNRKDAARIATTVKKVVEKTLRDEASRGRTRAKTVRAKAEIGLTGYETRQLLGPFKAETLAAVLRVGKQTGLYEEKDIAHYRAKSAGFDEKRMLSLVKALKADLALNGVMFVK